jgi:hypothetical protein
LIKINDDLKSKMIFYKNIAGGGGEDACSLQRGIMQKIPGTRGDARTIF